MKFRPRNLKVFILAALAYLVGQYFRGVWFMHTFLPSVCNGISVSHGVRVCYSPYIDTLGWPLITAGAYLAIVAVVLLFANKAGWQRWLNISKWYLPIAIFVVILLFPLGPLGAGISRSDGATFFGNVYFIITLCVVIIERSRARCAGKKSAEQ